MNRALRLPVVAVALLGAAVCGGEGPRPAPRRHVVEIRAFAYSPATLVVAPGDTVVWVNRDAVPHTATSADGAWDSGSLAPDASWSRVVEETGTDSYVCTFHPTMKGLITKN